MPVTQATATTEWITVEEAMSILDVGRARMQQLRKSGKLVFKSGRSAHRNQFAWTHVTRDSVEAYRSSRDGNVRAAGARQMAIRTRGTKRTKKSSQPAAAQSSSPSLTKYGDVYRMPSSMQVYKMTKSGLVKVDSESLIII
jgi:hypothetical protein